MPVLIHHGIRGQKWGERNGPPYPLEDKAHSKSEKKAKWKYSLNRNTNSNSVLKKISDYSTASGQLSFKKRKAAETPVKRLQKQRLPYRNDLLRLLRKPVSWLRTEYIQVTFTQQSYLQPDH